MKPFTFIVENEGRFMYSDLHLAAMRILQEANIDVDVMFLSMETIMQMCRGRLNPALVLDGTVLIVRNDRTGKIHYGLLGLAECILSEGLRPC